MKVYECKLRKIWIDYSISRDSIHSIFSILQRSLAIKKWKKAEFALMINHSLTLLPFFPFQLSSSAEKFLPLWMLDVFSHVGRKINMKCPMIHLDFHSWQHLWKLTFVLLSVQKLSPGRKQVHISQSSTTFSIRDSCSVAAEIFVFVSRGWEKNGHAIYRQRSTFFGP